MASMASVLLALWVPRHGWVAVLFVVAICTAAGAAQGFVHAKVFAVSGSFGALTAIFLVARGNSGGPSLADSLLLPSIAAVVVGGTAITGGIGSVWQTLVGALIIAVLRVAINVLHWDPNYEQIFYGFFVIVAVGLTIDRRKLAIVK